MTRVLVVDDSALMRRLLRDILAGAGGFEVETARHGAEALEMIRARKPDVVTLDIAMPEMDGLVCLGRIMVEAPCPVVMVSSLTRRGAALTLEALHLGAVDYVTKPGGSVSLGIDDMRDLLVAKVRIAASTRLRPSFRLADRVRHRAGAAADRPAPTATPAPAAARLEKAGAARAGIGAGGIVVVGASTGGPHALEVLLSALPADFPLPVLVAQHMPASFTGVFAERLNAQCALEVTEVTAVQPIAPGRVYIGHGDADLIVSRRAAGPAAICAPALPGSLWHPSVDRLVSSCMDHYPPGAIAGVLMTGMGNDGAAAMTALHAAGGRTIAEAESTAVVWGMPGDLVRRGGAERTAPLAQIAGTLLGMLAPRTTG